jgi:hypothetical protein
MWNDLVNGLIELVAAGFVLNHCRVLLRDRAVAGVSIVSTVFFALWGLWNLHYYPSLDQWLSFCGGLCIVVANTFYIVLLVRFKRLGLPNRHPSNPMPTTSP